MKITRNIFSDHYKTSTDVFRKLLGLYWTINLNNGQLIHTTNPIKSFLQHSNLEFSKPKLIDDETGLYKQTVILTPQNIQSNIDFLNSRYSFTANDIESVEQEMDGIVNENGYVTNVVLVKEKLNQVLLDATQIYRDYNTKTVRLTQPLNSSDAENVDFKSVYNFFIEQYEAFITPDLIPEEVLPNFYVTSLALDKSILSTIDQSDINNKDIASNLEYSQFKSKFDKFITLDKNISLQSTDNILVAFGLVEYYKQYADKYDSVSIDLIDTIKTRFGRLFNNLTNKEIVQKLESFKISYPMYIELLWETPTFSPLLEFISNAGISLQAFQSFINEHILLDINSENLNYASIFANSIPFNIVDYDDKGNELTDTVRSLYLHEAGAWLNIFLNNMMNGEDNQPLQAPNANVTFLNGNSANSTDITDRSSFTIGNILTALAAKPKLNELLSNTIRSYEDIINGELAQSEILFYRIEKRDKNNNVIQNFYVTNISDIDIQNFVDTQVKYKKEYQYKIFAFTVIYGTDYYYSNRTLPVKYLPPDDNADPVIVAQPVISVNPVDLNPAYLDSFAFDVYYSPNIQLVQLDYTDTIIAKIIDFPPTPPVVEFFPIKDCATKFNISLSPSSGEIRDYPKAIEPGNNIPFSGDQAYFAGLSFLQKSSDGKVTFRYEGDIKSYKVYRIEEAPTSYFDFMTKESSFVREVTGSENILFQEKIKSNIDYYYIFRTYDKHGERSNPSPIYKVKLYENDGVEYLDISVYNFIEKKAETIKTIKKYIKIDTSLLQKIYNNTDNKLGLMDESVYDNEFVMKVTSKHTNKQINVIFKFSKINNAG